MFTSRCRINPKNNKDLKRVFVFLAVIVFFSACTVPRLYTPNRNPTPLFESQGDLRIDFSSNGFNKVDLGLGYAFANRFAGYAGIASARESSSSWTSSDYFSSTIKTSNFGLGYFVNQAFSPRTRFELFADVALINSEIYRSFDRGIATNASGRMNVNSIRKGILLNIANENYSKKIRYGYSFRFSNLNFSSPKSDELHLFSQEVARIESKRSYYVLEHGLFFTLGKGDIRLQWQQLLHHGFYTNELNHAVQQFNFSTNIGLLINTNILMKPY